MVRWYEYNFDQGLVAFERVSNEVVSCVLAARMEVRYPQMMKVSRP